jgi:hypothetical protein
MDTPISVTTPVFVKYLSYLCPQGKIFIGLGL